VEETDEEAEQCEWAKGYSNVFEPVEMVVGAFDTLEGV
jgi:hypothetical protein